MFSHQTVYLFSNFHMDLIASTYFTDSTSQGSFEIHVL